MKQILIKQGKAVVDEVPAPQVEDGCVLVEVDHSCISVGTEISGVKLSGMPLWKRALQRPQDALKVVDMVRKQGISRVYSYVTGQLNAGTPVGYSLSGAVTAVGAGIEDTAVGDTVACAGVGFASHAEIVCVPRNLAVPIPPGVALPHASTVALGAIALQAVRRAAPAIGETFVVIGLGILGQLSVQILKAAGCRVIGSDIDDSRTQLALKNGMDLAIDSADKTAAEQAARLTDGIGADGVIVCASSPSSDILSTAFNMCRKKGRVVLVGDVGMEIKREDIYKKELDFLISTSYGPGRYDRLYEEKGIEYPVGYVRWTENRNMQEYLRMIGEGKIRLESLIQKIEPVENAAAAYEFLQKGESKPLMVLLRYSKRPVDEKAVSTIPHPRAIPAGKNEIRVAVVGAGSFARSMHLPNLAGMRGKFRVKAIMSRTGHNAESAARQFEADYSTTSYDRVLEDNDVDAVLICTRHNLHAGMTLKALKAGKHVLVEKPLALTATELQMIRDHFETSKSGNTPVLLTGFNRRFSPFTAELAKALRQKSGAFMMNYQMNAGHVPSDNWLFSNEGGGRNIGEACHIYDLFTFLTNSEVETTSVSCMPKGSGYYGHDDNFVATFVFGDGTTASLTYTSMGSSEFPKEVLELFFDGKVAVLNDYASLYVHGSRKHAMYRRFPDKGHEDELLAFWKCIRDGGEWPIPLWQQVQAMEMAFEVEKQLGAS